jgi:hypothetical protein
MFVKTVDELLMYFCGKGKQELYEAMVESLGGLVKVGKRSRMYLKYYEECHKDKTVLTGLD